MDESNHELSQYTVQQLQLELLRRHEGTIKGVEVVAFLQEHPELWNAVLFTRIEFLPSLSKYLYVPLLPHLVRMPQNIWAGESLYILAPGQDEAEQLRLLGVERKLWHKNEAFVFDDESSVMMLGGGWDDVPCVMVARLG